MSENENVQLKKLRDWAKDYKEKDMADYLQQFMSNNGINLVNFSQLCRQIEIEEPCIPALFKYFDFQKDQ